MEFFLTHKDEPTAYLLIGTESFGSFWPDQGLQALMNVVQDNPEELLNIEIKTDMGTVLSVEEFLVKIQDLRVRSNG
tara:strand:+ start:2118 stop:2348 length:231 start_codon:yes stop_codon:yes gene_type:complete